MKQSPTIVLTGGGSGGHITPLFSLARELKVRQPDCEIVYIGHKGDHFDSLKASTSDFDFVSFIDGGKFRRYHGESLVSHLLDFRTLALNFRDFFKVITSIGAAFKILRRVKPDVIFSKGGFVVVPVGIAARLLRIPIVTHDSDSLPGLANRIVGRWAVINATGMPAKYYNYPAEKIRFVGVPVSTADLRAPTPAQQGRLKSELGFPAKSQVLLATGGGNGSKKLNDLLAAIAPSLLEANPLLHIIHVCGRLHEKAVNDLYGALLSPAAIKRVMVVGFSPDLHKYIAAADVIFSRAGATSLAEYALLAKACIIMPSPFLAGGHQLKNAEELSSSDAAVITSEETSGDELLVIVNELLSNQARRAELARHISQLARPDAAAQLAEIILKVASREEA